MTADWAAAGCRIADGGSTLPLKSLIPRIQSMVDYPVSFFMCERFSQHVEATEV